MTTRSHAHNKAASSNEAQPNLSPQSYEIQSYGKLRMIPLGLSQEIVKQHVDLLNQLLADSITLYNLYKKHHWQVTGPTFYQLHLLLDKHAGEILETVDLIAERVQTIGGVTTGMPFEVAKMTTLEHPPTGEEDVPGLLARTANAHVTIIKELRDAIEVTEQNKDYGTNDLLVSDVLRVHELQLWFISQHLVDTPITDPGSKK